MKILLIIFIAWILTGLLYFAIETYNLLDDEAIRNLDLPSPTWKMMTYGPFYWLIHLILFMIGWITR